MSLITDIWREQPGEWFCISSKSNKWDGDKFFHRSEFERVDDYIQGRMGRDLYACPHGFSHFERKKTYAVLPRLLWADLDDADPRKLEHKPTIALRSSPGRYVGLWYTDKIVTEELNKRMSYAASGDKSGWDLTQVLRLLPGTINYKPQYDKPKVKLLWDDGPAYRVRDLERDLPLVAHSKIVHRVMNSLAPHVTVEDGKRAARKFLVGNKYMKVDQNGGKRSDVCYRLIMRVAQRGGTEQEAFALVLLSDASEHYGGSRLRAWQDVQRIFSKRQVA